MPSARQHRCTWKFEREHWKAGRQRIAGVDEAGRGSLFGPVVAAAVILNPSRRILGINDSKTLSPRQRESLAIAIKESALAWTVGSADSEEIDRINIYQASRLAMQRAVLQISPPPDLLLVDAMRLLAGIPEISIIHGDALSLSIAAASIIAKVERDEQMRQWDRIYPQYQLGENKGYPTKYHRASLQLHGPTTQHRKSFSPVSILCRQSLLTGNR